MERTTKSLVEVPVLAAIAAAITAISSVSSVCAATGAGIARACFEYCIKQIDYIRIDTHKDNISMQTAIERFGFHKCGNIYVKGGAERIAYDYIS